MKYLDFQMHDLGVCDNYLTLPYLDWSEYWVSKCAKGFFVKSLLKNYLA